MNQNIYDRFASDLESLRASSNFRSIPPQSEGDAIDFTSNDYLGIARRTDWFDEFYSSLSAESRMLTSSASRLLAVNQNTYLRLERRLEKLYGRPALLFNSGYHANTGIISAIADRRTMIIADRLVHASIIDGIKLSNGCFTRFYHNDLHRLEELISRHEADFDTILVVVEGIYSMDGDSPSIDRLIEIKQRHSKVMLYVDEAHSFGCEGPCGLGLTAASNRPDMVDIMVGTFGKAAASQGAFAIVNRIIYQYLTNHARSFIFSTAIPPISVAWTNFVVDRIIGMNEERRHLSMLSEAMSRGLNELRSLCGSTSSRRNADNTHKTAIQPFIIGNSSDTLMISSLLNSDGIKVLPIRTPTVPPGTERLRFSLSASLTFADIDKALSSLRNHLTLAY